MSANFKSRFMNRMEHITRSGHTNKQNKSSTSTPNHAQLASNRKHTPNQSSQTTQEFSRQIPNIASSNPNSEAHTYNPTPQMSNPATPNAYDHWNHQPNDVQPVVHQTHEPANKLTAQQFQNYLEECSPVHQQQQIQQPNQHNQHFGQFQQNQNQFQPQQSQFSAPMPQMEPMQHFQFEQSYRGPPSAVSERLHQQQHQQPAYQPREQSQSQGPYGSGGQRYYRDTQSEDVLANSRRAHQKKRTKRSKSGNVKTKTSTSKPMVRRPVSLEFSRKPRKITYTPHTLNDLRAIKGGVNMGTGALGPDLEDESVRLKATNLKKVQQYAELVNQKNRAHRPKAKNARVQTKSKTQIAREYAVMVNRLNHQKQMKLKNDRSRGFKMTGNAAISGSSSASPAMGKHQSVGQRQIHSKTHSAKESKERQEKLVELQQLHIRNRAIAQHILHDTFG